MSEKIIHRKELHEIESLQEWLIDESISFRGLDGFRKRLKLDDKLFSKLLGITPGCYSNWRTSRKVPLRNRDKYHQEVEEYRQLKLGAQTTRLEAILGGFTDRFSGPPVFEVVVPSRTTPDEMDSRNSPHLWMPMENHETEAEREARLDRMKEDFYRNLRIAHSLADLPCECEICSEV